MMREIGMSQELKNALRAVEHTDGSWFLNRFRPFQAPSVGFAWGLSFSASGEPAYAD